MLDVGRGVGITPGSSSEQTIVERRGGVYMAPDGQYSPRSMLDVGRGVGITPGSSSEQTIVERRGGAYMVPDG